MRFTTLLLILGLTVLTNSKTHSAVINNAGDRTYTLTDNDGTPNSTSQTISLSSSTAEPYLAYSRKKGMGLTNYAGPGSHKRKLEEMHLSWYWNWGMNRNDTINPAIEYVPAKNQKWWPSLSKLAEVGEFYNLLTYNEPYHGEERNPTPQQAFNAWPDIVAAAEQYGQPGTRIGSPTTHGTSDAFQDVFMPMAIDSGLKIDFINNHRYPSPLNLLKKLKIDAEDLYAKYGKPIWQTEWAPADWSLTAGYTHAQSYTAVVEVLHYYESTSFVERYAIFPFRPSKEDTDVGYSCYLWETDEGHVQTPLGKLYANYRSSDIHGPYTHTAYYLHNMQYHQRLHDNGGNPATTTIYTEGDAVDFELEYAGNGNYFITNRGTGNRLAYNGATLSWTTAANSAAQWTLTESDHGWRYLDNVAHAKRLQMESNLSLGMTETSITGKHVRWAFIRSNTAVTNSASHPVFSSDTLNLGNAALDQAYSGSLSDFASDTDGNTLTFAKAVLSGPSWLNIAANGTLSGTPGAGDVGLNSWTVLVDDGTGGFGTALLNIDVKSVATNTESFETIKPTIKVYPNPASQFLNIAFSNYKEESSIVSIYNLNGQLHRNIKLDLDNKIQQINLNGFTDGLYLIRIADTRGNILGIERFYVNLNK